jgi:hypothetical protein
VRESRRTGLRALLGCSGAGETPGCGCGAAEVTDDGDQDCGRVVAMVVERRRSRGSEMRPRERIKVVEEGS